MLAAFERREFEMSRVGLWSAVVAAGSLMVVLPQTGSAQGSGDYSSTIQNQIASNVVYPKLAKLKGQGGTVVYAVTIDHTGAVQDAVVETSSGRVTLDEAVLGVAKNSAPYPAPPADPTVIHGRVVFDPNG